MATKDNIIGTSTSTPTTVASAAPECKPNNEIATATASSKKFDVPIKQAGPENTAGLSSDSGTSVALHKQEGGGGRF